MIAAGAVLTAGAAAAAVTVAPRPRLPVPTGPHRVGTTVRTWQDPSRAEPFGADPGLPRSVVAQFWYPAAPALDARPAPYLEPEAVTAIASLLGLPPLALGLVARASTRSYAEARPLAGRFPVLVYLPGFSGTRGENQAWFEDLASHGYAVISLDQPGTAAATVLPDGRVVRAIDRADLRSLMPEAIEESAPAPHRGGVELPGGIIPFLARDASFALDQAGRLAQDDELLGGRLDTSRAAVFGLSLGGYTAPEAARCDPRFRACLEVDAGQTRAVAAEGIAQSLMIMTRDALSMRRERERIGGWPEQEIADTLDTQRALFARSSGPSWYLTMNAMHHLSWTDIPLWTPAARWLGLAGPIAPARGTAAVTTWSRAFFDHTVKGIPAPLLTGGGSTWPEVGVERQ